MPRVLTRILVAAAAGLFLLVGVSIWSALMDPETEELNGEEIAGFIENQMLELPEDEQIEVLQDMELLVLADDVGVFRQAAAEASTIDAVAALPEVEPQALDEFVNGEISKKFPYVWPYVLSGSIYALGQIRGAEPIVAFYNPYFDVAKRAGGGAARRGRAISTRAGGSAARRG